MTEGSIYRKPYSLSSMPCYLDRPRLNKTLALAIQNPVVTVVAGQGYGKSSAVYSFLQSNAVVSLWVQLTERDNVSRHFWENLCSCVTLRNPDLGNSLLDLGFPETNRQLDRFYVLIEQAVKAMEGPIPPSGGDPHYVIVYDDFHLIHDSAILKLFNNILAFPLPNASVVLIARSEPRIKILPLLSKGLLARITVEDLRFTPEEMDEYFAAQHLNVSRNDSEAFWRDTEGWPLILSLVVQNAVKQNQTELRYSPELIKLPLFRLIDNFFFSFLDKDTRQFLVKLSLGEYWPFELLDKLDATGEQRKKLEQISFFIRYDSYLGGYRIHNLLIEFLKEKQHELSPEEQYDVYRKNAEWCFCNNLRQDAAMYYEKAGDYGGFLNLCFAFPIVLPGGIASFFLSIIERIPARDTQDAADDSDSVLGLNRREVILYLRYVTRARLLFAMTRFDESALVCRQAIAEFERQSTGSFNARILTPLYFCLGFTRIFTSCRTGDYDFFPCFEKANHYYNSHVTLVSKNFSQGNVSSYICQVGFPAKPGAFEEYLRAYARAAPLIVKIGVGHLSGIDSLGRCEYCYFKGDLQAAENFARQALTQARLNCQYETESRGLFLLLRIAIHTGNLPGIEEILRQLKAQLDIKEYQNRYVLYDIECAWFYAQAGELAPIAPWLCGDFEAHEVNNILRPLEILVRAKCFYAEKRYRAALSVLGTDKNHNNLDGFLLGKLEKTVLEAACWLRLADYRAAVEKLGEAREISREYGLDTPFVELGEDMRLLASLVLGSTKTANSVALSVEDSGYHKIQQDREWLESIMKRAAAYGKMITSLAARGLGAVNFQKDGGILLRRREKAVLIALSQGFTREEIARQEHLSLNAIKEIIKSIYRKLGAVNRADAIRIALVLGILKKVSH
ncbi:MAG: LuxR C-terminal-related transcriptional regulator [Treponema sp.]|jgi:LuxR family maltose regulon positive regulatory protein|nr:LuxR C-terminal-related transcriptional regulator [Treponema sp.]